MLGGMGRKSFALKITQSFFPPYPGCEILFLKTLPDVISVLRLVKSYPDEGSPFITQAPAISFNGTLHEIKAATIVASYYSIPATHFPQL